MKKAVAKQARAKEAATPAERALPGFALAYPRSAELDALLAKFEAGDYAAVRAGASRLARTSEQEDVRKAALDLRARLGPHPVSTYLFLLALALLAVLAAHYLGALRP